MSANGRVLVIKTVLPERAVRGDGGFHFDVVMLVEMGGRERNEREFRTLFAAAGLAATVIRPLQADRHPGRSMIEGQPAGLQEQ